jgi:hypothetical protein
MTYQKGQLENFEITAAEADILIQEIDKAYRVAYDEIDKEIAKSYAKFLEGVDPEDYYNEMIKFKRLEKLQSNIEEVMGDTFSTSNKATLEAEKLAMSNSYYRNLYQFQWWTNLQFIPLNNDLLNYAATGNESHWKMITQSVIDKINNKANYAPATGTLKNLLNGNNTSALDSIRKTINSGFIQGKSYRDMSKSIEKTLLGAFPKKEGGWNYNALRIARTEGGRTLSLGYLHSTEQATAQGVEMQKMWDATLDLRTRQAHARADGQVVGVTEYFKVDDEELIAPRVGGSEANVINCRCASVNLIDGVKPTARRGRVPTVDENGKLVQGESEVFSYKNYDQWMKDNDLKYNKNGRVVQK